MSAGTRLFAGIVLTIVGAISGQGWLIQMGIGMAAGAAAEMLMKPPKMGTQGRDLAANGTHPTFPLPVIYGTMRTGVQRVFVHTTDYDRILWVVGAVCHGPVEAIDGVYLDGNPALDFYGRVVPPSTKTKRVVKWKGGNSFEEQDVTVPTSIDYIGYAFAQYALGGTAVNPCLPKIAPSTANGGLGFRVDGCNADGDDQGHEVQVFTFDDTPFEVGDTVYLRTNTNTDRYLGDVGGIWGVQQVFGPRHFRINKTDHEDEDASGGFVQYASFDLKQVFDGTNGVPAWTDQHQGLGIAYILLRLRWHPEKWPNGIPNAEVLVRGRKVFDPRDSSVAWSRNPAVCLRDYLTNEVYGLGLDEAEIDDTAIVAEANYCDEELTTPAGSGVTFYDAVPISWSTPAPGGLALVNTTTPHGLLAGDTIRISGHSQQLLNGTFEVIPGDSGIASFLVEASITEGGQGGEVTLEYVNRHRYKLNGAVMTGQSLKQNLEEMLTSFRANLVYASGLYRPWVRKPTPVSGFQLDENNIIGGWELTLPGSREMCNKVRMSFLNAARNFKVDYADFPPNDGSYVNGFLADDNNLELLKEIDLPFTTDRTTALHIGMLIRRESRNGMVASVTANEEAFMLTVGDIVEVTHPTPGFDKKKFWVMGLGYVPGGQVRLSLFEYDSTSYDLLATDATPFDDDTTLPDPFTVQPPGSLEVTPDPLGMGRLIARWEESRDAFLRGYELQFRKSKDADPLLNPDGTPILDDQGNLTYAENMGWTVVAIVGPSVLTREIGGLKKSISYDVRVRAFNHIGAQSAWVTRYNNSLTQQPSPEISLLAEATPDGGATDEGMVHVVIQFEARTEEVHIYAIDAGVEQEHDPTFPDGPGLPTPEITANRLAGICRRPYGDVGKEDDWLTHFDIATNRDKWRKIIAFGVNGEVRGDPVTLEIQASDTGTGPSGTITTFAWYAVDTNSVPDGVPDTIRLFWSTSDTESEVRLIRDGQVIAVLPAGTTSFDDGGLVPGTDYYYQVQLIRDGQTTAPYSTTAIIPGAPLPAPQWFDVTYPRGGAGIPTEGRVRITATSYKTWVDLSWTGKPEAYSYIVESTTMGSSGYVRTIGPLAPGKTNYRLLPLVDGDRSTRYFSIYQSQRGFMDSPYSFWRGAVYGDPTITIIGDETGENGGSTPPGDYVLLSPAFASLTNEPQGTQAAARLNFTNPNGRGSTEIWAYESSSGVQFARRVAVVPYTATTYLDMSFPAGTRVRYYLVSTAPDVLYTDLYISVTREILLAAGAGGTTLTAPTLNSVAAGTTGGGVASATLSFTNRNSDSFTRVYRADMLSLDKTFVLITTVAVGTSTYADSTVNPMKRYAYRVTAYKTSPVSESGPSNVIEVEFTDGSNGDPGGSPTTLDSPEDDGSYGFTNIYGQPAVKLVIFNPDPDARTVVERANESGVIEPETWTQIVTLAPGVTIFDDAPLSHRQVYWYRLKATRSGYTDSPYGTQFLVESGASTVISGGGGGGGGEIDPIDDRDDDDGLGGEWAF